MHGQREGPRQVVQFLAMLSIFVCAMVRPVVGADDRLLKITVGEPTRLGPIAYQNSSSLSISRTGTMAAFYPRHDFPGEEGKQIIVMRVSVDGGVTWGDERRSPIRYGGACGTALRAGGVIRMVSHSYQLRAHWPLVAFMVRFTDDFSAWKTEAVTVDLPDPALTAQEPSPHAWAGPIFDKGKMVQLPDGAMLAPMYGRFIGDIRGRVILSRSNDQGRTWQYHATVGHDDEDPNPELPGEFGGYAEPSIALLPNGEMLCVMRAQSSHLPPDYKPLYISRSTDLGKTWTRPVPTTPHLMNIWPTLAVLDNGVVACVHGRPGFHVAFSTDNGRTWGNRVSFSHLPEPNITGQTDMIKVGPNKLLAIGGVPGGTKVFPVTVERVKDPSPEPFALTGRVMDHRGRPIAGATVARSPNRYTTEYQPIQLKPGEPTVRTGSDGRFRFEQVKRGETVVTVEAKGYAPSFRHVSARPGMASVEFALKPGRLIRGRVIDQDGKAVGGSCVFLGEDQHVHTDRSGRFGWVVEGTPPEKAQVRLVKRHVMQLSRAMTLAEIQRPIVVYRLAYPNDGPELVCVRVDTDQAPGLEAGFDDKVWAASPAMLEFWTHTVAGVRLLPVQARFAYDDKHLYVMTRVQSASKSTVPENDMIELYVAPDMDHRLSFQFAYNATGRIPGRFAWNTPYAKGRTAREPDGRWTVSVAILWLQLGMKHPEPETKLGLGIAHVQGPADNTESDRTSPPTMFRYGRLVLK